VNEDQLVDEGPPPPIPVAAPLPVAAPRPVTPAPPEPIVDPMPEEPELGEVGYFKYAISEIPRKMIYSN
jgi:hypothetical protein